MDSLRRKWEMLEMLERKMIFLQEGKCQIIKETINSPFPVLAPANQKEKVLHEYRQNNLLKQILQIYNEISSTKIENINDSSDLLSSFYSDLRDLRLHHPPLLESNSLFIDNQKYLTDDGSSCQDINLENMLFSGEESFGRFLDLSPLHQEYLNLIKLPEPSYISYINEFDSKHLERPSLDISIREWREYLKKVLQYLISFIKKTHPLLDYSLDIINNDSFANDGIWCERCSHLFTNPSVYKNHLTGRKHLNGLEGVEDEFSTLSPSMICLAIGRILKNHLKIIREATAKRCERRQALTWEEREKELEQETKEFLNYKEIIKQKMTLIGGAVSSSTGGLGEEHEGKIYNPLNLPLDWDGKPIPYWLWKLHGLGTSFPCEICGNWAYKGRKAFDDHFVEGRHSQGMKSLGIPNTKHLHQVTSISEALWLWDGLKRSGRKAVFRPDVMEEFEDDEGNVYSRKTYEDLRRQGLI